MRDLNPLRADIPAAHSRDMQRCLLKHLRTCCHGSALTVADPKNCTTAVKKGRGLNNSISATKTKLNSK